MSDGKPLSKTIRVRRGGRVTIPAEFRRRLGIDDQTLLLMSVEDGVMRVLPVPIEGLDEESDWLDALYQAYAPIRAEILARGISEEEINADIDTAIAEVRAEKLATRT